jgi:hypothetical protein
MNDSQLFLLLLVLGALAIIALSTDDNDPCQ